MGGDLVPVQVPFANPTRRPMSNVHEPNHISLPCAFSCAAYSVQNTHTCCRRIFVPLSSNTLVVLSSIFLVEALESSFTVCTRPKSLARPHSFRTINYSARPSALQRYLTTSNSYLTSHSLLRPTFTLQLRV